MTACCMGVEELELELDSECSRSGESASINLAGLGVGSATTLTGWGKKLYKGSVQIQISPGPDERRELTNLVSQHHTAMANR